MHYAGFLAVVKPEGNHQTNTEEDKLPPSGETKVNKLEIETLPEVKHSKLEDSSEEPVHTDDVLWLDIQVDNVVRVQVLQGWGS